MNLTVYLTYIILLCPIKLSPGKVIRPISLSIGDEKYAILNGVAHAQSYWKILKHSLKYTRATWRASLRHIYTFNFVWICQICLSIVYPSFSYFRFEHCSMLWTFTRIIAYLLLLKTLTSSRGPLQLCKPLSIYVRQVKSWSYTSRRLPLVA